MRYICTSQLWVTDHMGWIVNGLMPYSSSRYTVPVDDSNRITVRPTFVLRPFDTGKCR